MLKTISKRLKILKNLKNGQIVLFKGEPARITHDDLFYPSKPFHCNLYCFTNNRHYMDISLNYLDPAPKIVEILYAT